jgi:hypothetical protein
MNTLDTQSSAAIRREKDARRLETKVDAVVRSVADQAGRLATLEDGQTRLERLLIDSLQVPDETPEPEPEPTPEPEGWAFFVRPPFIDPRPFRMEGFVGGAARDVAAPVNQQHSPVIAAKYVSNHELPHIRTAGIALRLNGARQWWQNVHATSTDSYALWVGDPGVSLSDSLFHGCYFGPSTRQSACRMYRMERVAFEWCLHDNAGQRKAAIRPCDSNDCEWFGCGVIGSVWLGMGKDHNGYAQRNGTLYIDNMRIVHDPASDHLPIVCEACDRVVIGRVDIATTRDLAPEQCITATDVGELDVDPAKIHVRQVDAEQLAAYATQLREEWGVKE